MATVNFSDTHLLKYHATTQTDEKQVLSVTAQGAGTVTSDTVEWPYSPQGLTFVFSGNAGTTMTCTWTVQGSFNDSDFHIIGGGTLVSGATLTGPDFIVSCLTGQSGTVSPTDVVQPAVPIQFRYYKVVCVITGANSDYAIDINAYGNTQPA